MFRPCCCYMAREFAKALGTLSPLLFNIVLGTVILWMHMTTGCACWMILEKLLNKQSTGGSWEISVATINFYVLSLKDFPDNLNIKSDVRLEIAVS